MISICVMTLDNIDLDINIKKSACMRIGPRFDKTEIILFINGMPLKWKNEINYLGVLMLADKSFRCNLQTARNNFFKAVKEIFGKMATFASPKVVLSLIATSCIPIITYGLNACNLNKSSNQVLDSAYESVYFKIFQISDKSNVALCQHYFG